MLKWKDFSIGGYNFDDYSLVKELYIPTDVAMNPARTLHIRGTEALPHHLRHYFVPYGKVFIGLRATVRLTQTNGIGLLGTHFRWRKGVTAEWQPNTYYYIGNEVRQYLGIVYQCAETHTSGATFDPSKWNEGSQYALDWAPGKGYFRNEFIQHPFDWNGTPLMSGYRALSDHTSSIAGEVGDEPGLGDNWETYWDIGDEMQADLSWPYYEYQGNPGFVPAIKLSEGKIYQFSRDVIGKFRGWHSWPATNHEGRALDALATTGYMKQDGILWGVEVDDEEYYHES